jgi:GT2 family glycosyltransferase
VHDSENISVGWVVLTMGDRPIEVVRAVESLVADDVVEVVVVANGVPDLDRFAIPGADVITAARNLGVPGGRDTGLRATSASVVGFLDDDAVLRHDGAEIARAFEAEPTLGAVSLRIVDESGRSNARHVPRPGGRDPDVAGQVAQFLGGACAIRRDAYDQVGGYFTDLFYGHEEIELCWRLIDAGWSIRYLPEVEVFHPRTEISRHDFGWRLTGRNRVWIARRTLPWPIAIVHVGLWLVLGLVRAPEAACRRSYLAGWWSGWQTTWTDGSRRQPISWRAVWRLTRLGRPPLI